MVHRKLAEKFPGILTIIVPRHPERGDEITSLLRETGLNTQQRSRDEQLGDETNIYVADTLGELGLFYRLCPIAFIGRSLVKGYGGSNALEPAQLGCVVIQGKHTDNFATLTNLLLGQKAMVRVEDWDDLALKVVYYLSDEVASKDMIASARTFAQGEAIKAVNAVYKRLEPVLPPQDTEVQSARA